MSYVTKTPIMRMMGEEYYGTDVVLRIRGEEKIKILTRHSFLFMSFKDIKSFTTKEGLPQDFLEILKTKFPEEFV